MPAMIVTLKIGMNVADFALAVDRVLAARRERERDLPVDDRGMNIAAQIGDVYSSAIVIDDQFRGAGRLDAIADPNFAAPAETMRAVPRNIRRGNGYIVAVLFGLDLGAFEAPLRFGARGRVVEMLARPNHGNFDFGTVPAVDVHFAERIFHLDRSGCGYLERVRMRCAQRLPVEIVGQERKRQEDRDRE